MGVIRALHQPGIGSPWAAGHELIAQLQSTEWTEFRCAVAFVRSSGVRHIGQPLYDFSRRNGTNVNVAVGISRQGSSLEGVQDLWRILQGHGMLGVFHDHQSTRPIAFHPKMYALSNQDYATVIIGSSNLTESGLYLNHEASLAVDLDLSDPEDSSYFSEVTNQFDYWQNSASPSYKEVTPQLLQSLHDTGDLPSELTQRVASRVGKTVVTANSAPNSTPFGGADSFGSSSILELPPPPPLPSQLPSPPVTPRPVQTSAPGAKSSPPPASGGANAGTNTGSGAGSSGSTPGPQQVNELLMEVRPHHNGEVFLSYRAIQSHPIFFGHPFTGWSTPTRSNVPYPMATPDPLVIIRVYDSTGKLIKSKQHHNLNMVDYEAKHEIRITLPDRLQDHVPQLSLLRMVRNPDGVHDYLLEFYAPGAPQIAALAPYLIHSLPRGGASVARRYGWR